MRAPARPLATALAATTALDLGPCDCVESGLGDRDDMDWHGVGTAPDVVRSHRGPTFPPTSTSGSIRGSIRGSRPALPYALDDGFQQAVPADG